MPYLDAALAFALTMLAVAIIVQQIMVLPLRQIKKEQLINSLKIFVAKEIQPIVQRRLNQIDAQLGRKLDAATEKSLTAARTALTDSKSELLELQSNLLAKLNAGKVAVPGLSHEARQQALSNKTEIVPTNDATDENLKGAAILKVSAEEIIGLIRKSKAGQDIEKALGKEADAVFGEMADGYNKIRNHYRDFVRKWAVGVGIAVGIVFCILMNVNTFTLLRVYVTDEAATLAVIAQAPVIQASFKGGCDAQTLASATVTQEQLALCASLDALQQNTKVLSDSFPVGWTGDQWSLIFSGQITKAIGETVPQGFGLLFWLIGCAISGALAGIGAPFWYDTVRRITGFRNKVVSVGQGGSQA